MIRRNSPHFEEQFDACFKRMSYLAKQDPDDKIPSNVRKVSVMKSKDSQFCPTETKSIHTYLSNTRSDLLKQDVIVKKGTQYIFTQDYTFNSPSTAAGVIQARNSNGRIDWKDKSGKTLKELQMQDS